MVCTWYHLVLWNHTPVKVVGEVQQISYMSFWRWGTQKNTKNSRIMMLKWNEPQIYFPNHEFWYPCQFWGVYPLLIQPHSAYPFNRSKVWKLKKPIAHGVQTSNLVDSRGPSNMRALWFQHERPEIQYNHEAFLVVNLWRSILMFLFLVFDGRAEQKLAPSSLTWSPFRWFGSPVLDP